MGQPIIGHLAKKGFTVRVNDIDAGKRAVAEQRGGQWSADPAAVARASEAILVCVGYDRELRELLSKNGIPQHARAGTIIAILSTVHPDTVRELAEQGREHGLHVVDATMCRGGWAADEGTLLCFVAGHPETVSRLKPVLAAFSSDIIHTGDIGTAQVAKAVNNMIMWACLVADHEGLALARRYGLDIEMMRSALLTTHSANGALEHWGKQTMAWADDDMEIVAAMAKEKGLALKQAEAVQEICRWLKPIRFQLEQYGPVTTGREGRKGKLRNAKDAKVAKK
jgi:3-hydroxyisobutyrate dehydrogenase-like beta-hydroxyacid dehydrogenase